MSQKTLFVHGRDFVTLSEAVSVYASIEVNRACALLYSPRSCVFAALVGGSLQGSDGQPVDLKPVFEARVYSTNTELRWLNDPSHQGRHRAVILAEDDFTAKLGESWSKEANPVIDTLPQTYLLWGEGTGNKVTDGWSQLATARIGVLPIPLPDVAHKQRVLLRAVEYLSAEPDHGNVVVCEERLCGMEVDRG